EPVEQLAALRDRLDEPGLAEDSQMLRHRGSRHGQPTSEIARALRPATDVVEKAAAGGIGERAQGSGERRRLDRTLSHGRYVTDRLPNGNPPPRPSRPRTSVPCVGAVRVAQDLERRSAFAAEATRALDVEPEPVPLAGAFEDPAVVLV